MIDLPLATTAKYTTNLRDQLENYVQNPFPEQYDFYTNSEEVKDKFEHKYVDYYYFRDIEYEQFALYKHKLKALLNLIMPKYKQMFELKLDELELNNVDITEIIERDTIGSGTSKSNATSTNDSNSSNKNKVVDHDTPQGKVNLDQLNRYASGVTGTDGSDQAHSKSDSSGSSENTATGREDSERRLKGYQGSKTITELRYELLENIVNIDKMIIDECEVLFLNVF